MTKLLIDLGDRNAGPGVPRNLSILPFNPLTFNPIQFSADFVEAVAQGIEDAFCGSSMIAVPVPAPASSLAESETDESSALTSFSRLASESTDAEAPAEVQETDASDTAAADGIETADGGATVTLLPVDPQKISEPGAGDDAPWAMTPRRKTNSRKAKRPLPDPLT